MVQAMMKEEVEGMGEGNKISVAIQAALRSQLMGEETASQILGSLFHVSDGADYVETPVLVSVVRFDFCESWA